MEQSAFERLAEREALLSCGLSEQHLAPVVGAGPWSGEVDAVREEVVGDVVRVRPDAQLRVVGKLVVLSWKA